MAKKSSKKKTTKTVKTAKASGARRSSAAKVTKKKSPAPRKPASTKSTPKGAKPAASAKKSKPQATAKKAATRNVATRNVAARNAKPVARAFNGDITPSRPQKSGLSKRDLESLRKALMDKRAELVGDMTRMRDEALSKNRQDAAGNLSNMPIHMADIGTDNYEQEFTLGLLDNERAILHEIDEALNRMDRGVYGICLGTGEPIGLARLRAQPWARYSYEYMLQRERQRGGRY